MNGLAQVFDALIYALDATTVWPPPLGARYSETAALRLTSATGIIFFFAMLSGLDAA